MSCEDLPLNFLLASVLQHLQRGIMETSEEQKSKFVEDGLLREGIMLKDMVIVREVRVLSTLLV